MIKEREGDTCTRPRGGVHYWFGRGTGADDLIDALGAVDTATQEGLEGEQSLNAEGVIAAAPDLFLVMTTGLESVGGIDGLRAISGIRDTPRGQLAMRGRHGRQPGSRFGSQFPATLRALAQALYGVPAADGS